MGKYLGWISTTAIALAGLVMGVFDVDFGPRWIWFATGIVFGFLAAFTFKTVWASADHSPPLPSKVEQKPTMTAGKNSTQIVNEGGGNFDINTGKDH